jgi:hypothetical protein
MGIEASPVAVAAMYAGIASSFVVDTRDAGLVVRIEELGYRTLVHDTVMDDGGGRLAVGVLAAFEGATK